MKKTMCTAAVLMGLTTGLHLFGGTSEIMNPILNADIHPVIKGTSMVVWHAITAILALMAVGIFYLARHKNDALAYFIIAIQLAFAGLFIFYNASMLDALFAMPQWTIFLGIAAVMGVSLYKDA